MKLLNTFTNFYKFMGKRANNEKKPKENPSFHFSKSTGMKMNWLEVLSQ